MKAAEFSRLIPDAIQAEKEETLWWCCKKCTQGNSAKALW